MTAEDVLAVLSDDHRQQVHYDEMADPDAVISFDMTVHEWRWACDLVQWKELGRAMNVQFRVFFTDGQWREVLKPEKKKTLRGVCELIASKARVPIIKPLRILGRSCRTAGVFLTIRALLQKAGADVSELRPSSDLAPFTVKYRDVFLREISKIAPGALPPVRVHHPMYDEAVDKMCRSWLRGMLCYLLGIILAVACWIIFGWGMGLVSSVPLVIGLVLFIVLDRRRNEVYKTVEVGPESASFGELRTFKDLARAIAEWEENGAERQLESQ